MTIDDPRRDEWQEALRAHEREIDRLRVELVLLEREQHECGDPDLVRDFVRLEIELATAQITRHRIGAALMGARLRSLA